MNKESLETSVFSNINVCNNTKLRNCFWFFFAIAICGYLSIMVSFCPYSDDYCRYLVNINVGTSASNRIFTFLLESLSYLSSVITDAAPFSHVLSCIFLAYGAVICLKIFKVDLNNKLEILCFVPIIVNPYMLEIMMFRFDNPFSTLALLFCIVAAYVSTTNNKALLFTQTGLFLLSLFIYQPASSAYFILGIYKFLEELRSGKSVWKTILKMRYWIYAVSFSVIAYIPFIDLFNYCVVTNGPMLALPFNMKNINIILKNISIYYFNLYTDWFESNPGYLFFFIFVIFAIHSLSSIKKVVPFAFYLFGIFILTLCPLGACLFMKIISFGGNENIVPRSLYSIGILLSGALYGACSLFRVSKKAYTFYSVVVSCLCLWSIIFTNSAGNVIHTYRILQRHVLYDVSKDIHKIREQNKNLSGFYFSGRLQTFAMNNFTNLYPIMNRIIPEKWYVPTMAQLATIDYEFANSFIKNFPVDEVFDITKFKNKELVRSSLMYDIFIWDKKAIQVHFKSSYKDCDICLNYARIKD